LAADEIKEAVEPGKLHEWMTGPILTEVIDDAMEPTLKKGDLLLAQRIELRRGSGRPNGTYLVADLPDQPTRLFFHSSIFPRRVEWTADGSAIAKCDNPAYPRLIEIDPSGEGPHIHSHVMWVGRLI
jgi:hypothetical protein